MENEQCNIWQNIVLRGIYEESLTCFVYLQQSDVSFNNVYFYASNILAISMLVCNMYKKQLRTIENLLR